MNTDTTFIHCTYFLTWFLIRLICQASESWQRSKEIVLDRSFFRANHTQAWPAASHSSFNTLHAYRPVKKWSESNTVL